MGSEPHSFVGRLTASALGHTGQKDRPHYLSLLDDAFVAAPPVYGEKWFGDLFRTLGRNPNWVASLMASDSYMEGYSAGRLWQYAGVLDNPMLSQSMLRHADDEARHSRIFTKTLFKTFPSLENPTLLDELNRNAPDLDRHPSYPDDFPSPSEEEILNSMILINLFEIKALVLGKLMQPLAVAHAPEDHKRVVSRMLGAIVGDEAHHIRYSADFIEHACQQGHRDVVATALRDFQQTLNEVTARELHDEPPLDTYPL